MSDTAEKPNPNDPRSHERLRLLLDDTEALGLGKHALSDTRVLLEHALTLPEGATREVLLRHLNMGLFGQQRRKELYESNQKLSEQLKTEKPDLAELNLLLSPFATWVKLLRDKFRQVYEVESKKGQDLWKTAWPWYEHELYCYTDAMQHQIKKIEGATRKPAPGNGS